MGMAYATINLYDELKKLSRGKPTKVPVDVLAWMVLGWVPPEPRKPRKKQKQKPRRKSKRAIEIEELERLYRLESE